MISIPCAGDDNSIVDQNVIMSKKKSCLNILCYLYSVSPNQRTKNNSCRIAQANNEPLERKNGCRQISSSKIYYSSMINHNEI